MHELIPLRDLLILLYRAHIDATEGGDCPFQFVQAALRLADILDRFGLLLRLAPGELIFIKQAGDRSIVLLADGGLFFLQPGQFAAELFPLRALGALKQAQLRTLLLLLLPLGNQRVDLCARVRPLQAQLLDLILQGNDILIQRRIFLLRLGDLIVKLRQPAGVQLQPAAKLVDCGRALLNILIELQHFQIDAGDLLIELFTLCVEFLAPGGQLRHTGVLLLRLLCQCVNAGGDLRLFALNLIKARTQGLPLRIQPPGRIAGSGELGVDQADVTFAPDLLLRGILDSGLGRLILGAAARLLLLGGKELLLAHAQLILHFFDLGGELFQLIRTADHAGGMDPGTARHGAAGIEHLAVQRDDLKPVAILFGNGDGTVHILRHGGTPKQGLNHRPVLPVVCNEIRRDIDKAPAAGQPRLIERTPVHACQRQEGRAAKGVLFQVIDGALGIGLGIRDDILHCGAERRLNCGGIAVLRVDDLRDGTVNAGQRPGARLLHHSLDAAGIALHVLLHVVKHLGSGLRLPQLDGQVIPRALRIFQLLAAFFRHEGIPVQRVGYALKLLLTLFQPLLRLLPAALKQFTHLILAGERAPDLLQPRLNFRLGRLIRRQRDARIRNLQRQCGDFRGQRLHLPAEALVLAAGAGQRGRELLQPAALLLKRLGKRGDPLLMRKDLTVQLLTRGVGRVLIPPDALNRLVIVFN